MSQLQTPSRVESLLTPEQIDRRRLRTPSRVKGAMCLDYIELCTLLAHQPTQMAAIKALAGWFSDQFPNAIVRVAWGSHKPKGMIDHRLGRLGPESSLWQTLTENWQRQFSPEGTEPDEENRIWLPLCSSEEVEGNPTQPFAVLWVESLPLGANIKQQIAPAAAAIGAILWSRPRVHLTPRWLALHRRWVLGLIAAVLVGAIVACWPTPYRVRCQGTLQPFERRVVATPFEATLLECLVEPGDQVSKDQLLMIFDGRPLQLELEALRADLSQSRKQHSASLAEGKIADAQLAELERLQLEQRIQVIQDRLAKLEVRSPIDGVVLSGDMERSIGAPLKTGEPLLEIAPLDRLLMEVEIPEEEIRYASIGDRATARLNANARRLIEGKLERIYPQAEIRREANVFVARWEVPNQTHDLRPGMQGTAVVYGPNCALAWPWIRRGQEAILRAIGW